MASQNLFREKKLGPDVLKKYVQSIYKNFSTIAYICVLISLIAAGTLLIFYPEGLTFILKEDSITETLGAVFLFLTSLNLFLSSFNEFKLSIQSKKNSRIKYLLLVLAAIAFFWAGGEEISWGQRILEIDTPEVLMVVNQQRELNLHNINTRFFNNALETIILLCIIVPTILKTKGIERVFGFFIPSFSVVLGFQLISCYVTYSYIKPQDCFSYIFLLYYFYSFFRAQDWKNLNYILVNTIVIVFLALINTSLRAELPTNGPRELREFLFAFLCYAYSIEIIMDQKILYLLGIKK